MNYAGKFGSGGLASSSTAHLDLDSLSHRGGHGDTVIVPDAHLLFSGDFARSGRDLIISDASHRFVVQNYFDVHKRPALVSPDGAPLDPRVVDALTGHVDYAQAGGAPAAKVVGNVVKMTGSASVVRNGVTVVLNNGDALYQGDVVQTGSGSTIGLVLVDGTAFNLTANARLMLNDLTYDASSSSNSSLLTLVQGAASFVAGQVAKTGDMKVATPVATMGIRGTAVILDISAIDGKVSVSVLDQGDGQVHSVQVFTTNAAGALVLIGTVTSTGAGLTLTPTATFEVVAEASNKTPAQVAAEFNAFQALLSTYDAGKQLIPDLPQHTENKGGGDKDTSPATPTKYASSAPANPTAPEYTPPAGSTSVATTSTQTAQVVVTTSSSSGGGGGSGTPPPTTTTTDSPPVIKTVTFTPVPFVVTPPTVASITADGGDHNAPVMSASGDVVYDPDGIIYFYDRETKTTIRVTPDDGRTYSGQTISSDGRYIVYQSDDGGQSHVYVWGTDPADAAHYHVPTLIGAGGAPAVSGDGQTILVELGGKIGIYDLDGHLKGTITAAAVNATGSLWLPSVSADGHIIAFWSSDTGSPGGPGHLYVYDKTTATYTEIASVATGAGNHTASISADGHLVAYEGVSAEGRAEIYLYDLNTGQVVFSTADLDITFEGASRNPVISPDGKFIIFTSDARLLAADGNAFADTYLVDVSNPAAPSFRLISEGSNGASDGGVAISAGGAYVAFASNASFAGGGATTNSNIFFADPTSGRSTIIDQTSASPSTLSASGSIAITGAVEGVTLSVTDAAGNPTSLLTASLNSGNINWAFAEAKSDFAGLAYGQDTTRSFIITMSSNGGTTTIPVSITVHNSIQPTIVAVNAPPVAVPLALTAGQEDTSYVIAPATLLNAVSDVDGPTPTITSVTVQSGGGTVSQNGSGDWIYTPPVNSTGHVVLNYTASDGTLSANSTASFTLVGTGVTHAGDDNDNTLTGTPANDAFEGFGGDDTIIGLAGVDRAVYTDATGGITADLAAGTVSGPGVGADTLIGVEAIQASNFADTLSAAGFTGNSGVPGVPLGFNSFEGMGGDDTITGNVNGQNQKLTRVVYANATAAVTVDFQLGQAHGTAPGDLSNTGTDTFTNVNAVIGSAYGDTLLGSDNAPGSYEQYEGRRGNDFVDGRGGYDFAVYNNDPDTTSGVTVDMAAGTVIGDGSIGTDTLRGVEGVRGTNFSDVYHAENFGAPGYLNPATNNVGSSGTFNNFDGAGGNDTIFGNGNTRIQYSNATAGVTVDFVLGTAHGTAPGNLSNTGTDTFTGVNAVMGSTFGDDLRGDGNNNNFMGLAGDDFIDGRGGFDTAQYNNIVYATGGITVDMAAGIVTGDGSIGTDTLRGVEAVLGTGFADTYDAANFGRPGYLNPATNNVGIFGTFNQFEGAGGDDQIWGNGNTKVGYFSATAAVTVDLVDGTARASDIDAGIGVDTFHGGIAGIGGSAFGDTLRGSNNASGTVEQFDGRAGDDLIDGRGGYDQAVYSFDAVSAGITVTMTGTGGTVDGNASVGHDTLVAVESVIGTRFADSYDASLFSGFNEFQALGGNDSITGNGFTQIGYFQSAAGIIVDLQEGTARSIVADNAGIGVDTIHGGVNSVQASNFSDILLGSSAAEIFGGQAGNDQIDGRGGGDYMSGNAGADTFVYSLGYGNATIGDFSHAEGDRIDLRGVPGVFSLNDLQMSQLGPGGTDTLIQFGDGGSLVLTNVNFANLVDADFIFAAPDNHSPDVTLGGGDSGGSNLAETNDTLAATGTLTISDTDATDQVTVSVSSSVTHTGPTGGLSDATLQSYFTVPLAPVLDSGQSSAHFTWTFDSKGQTFDFLKAGETLSLTYTITPDDGHPPAGTGSFGVAIAITGENDAPLLNSAALGAVPEDTPEAGIAGATVAELFGNEFSDVDGTMVGIAVSGNGAAAGEGVWQYKTPTGGIWEDIGSPDPEHALAFTNDTMLRFVPAANYSGTPGSLEVHAIDDTYDEEFTIGAGQPGGRYTINITDAGDEPLGHGGTSPISADAVALGTSVTPVNDPPEYSGNAVGLASDGGLPVALATNVTASDIDSDNYGGGSLQARITSFAQAGDLLSVANSGGIEISSDEIYYNGTHIGALSGGSGYDELIINLDSGATDAAVVALTQAIVFSSSSGQEGDREISFALADGGGENAAFSVTVAVTASANHAPTIDDTSWITRASVSSSGVEGDDLSISGAVSSAGVVAFSSDADNLVDDDSNGQTDIFVHYLEDGYTERVSVDSNGNQALGGSLDGPSISADGNFVAFVSSADNLVPGDNNNVATVYLRDLSAGTTEMVSVDGFDDQLGTESLISNHAVSDDGSYVVFETQWGIATEDDNGTWDIYVRDTVDNTTTLVSAYNHDVIPGVGASNYAVISGDGLFVAFNSTVDDLDGTAADNNGYRDVFVRDLVGGNTILVSDPADAEYANSAAYGISGDGRYVLYTSEVAGSSGYVDLIVRDLSSNDRTVVGRIAMANFTTADISADGRYVVYSDATADGGTGIYVHDVQKHLTMLVSVNSDGIVDSNTVSEFPAISADGRFVTFHSYAADLVLDDDNDTGDVFVVDLAAPSRAIHDTTNGSTLAAFGLVAFSDGDASDVHDASIVPLYGSPPANFEIDPAVTGIDGRGLVHWSFQIDHTSVAYLAAGDTATFTYNVIIDDGTDQAFQTVEITVVGANDAPSVDLDGNVPALEHTGTLYIGGSPVPISVGPEVADADTYMMTGATVVLSEGGADGDFFSVDGSGDSFGDLPSGIHWEIDGDASGSPPLTVTFSGDASPGDYASAIAAVSFGSSSSTEHAVDITVTVSDGIDSSYPLVSHIDVTVATDNVWIGPAVGDWYESGYWSLAHSPAGGDNVTINDAQVTIDVSYTQYTISQLTIGGVAELDISGSGEFVVSNDLSNEALIHAQDAAFTAGAGVTNRGTISASGQNSVLNFGGSAGTSFDNAGGYIVIDGGAKAYFTNVTMQLGELASDGGQAEVVLRGSTFYGTDFSGETTSYFTIGVGSGGGSSVTTFDGTTNTVVIEATMNIEPGATLNLVGDIFQYGTLTVDPAIQPGMITITGEVNLTGGGTIVLEDPNLSVITSAPGQTATLSINDDNTISGTGQLGAGNLNINVDNTSGQIIADNAAYGLFIDTGAGFLVNHGQITSAAAGGIDIAGDISNESDGLLVANAGLFEIHGAVSGAGRAQIGAGILKFDGASDARVTFTPGDFAEAEGTLVLGDIGHFTGTITGYTFGDRIDVLGHDDLSLETDAGTGALQLRYGAGSGEYIVLGNYLPGAFTLADDGHGGTEVVYNQRDTNSDALVSSFTYAVGGALPGTAAGGQSGVHVIGISTDGVNFVDVNAEDAGQIDGTYLHFEAHYDGSTTWSIGTAGYADTHALIAAIETNENQYPRLTDSFYYKVEDASGKIWIDKVTYAPSDLSFDGVGQHTLGVAHGEFVSLGELAVHDWGIAEGFAPSQIAVTVTVGFGELSLANPASGGAVADFEADHRSVTIYGTESQINATLNDLRFTSATGGHTDIVMRGNDGQAYTGSYYVGTIAVDDVPPTATGDMAVITAKGHAVAVTTADLNVVDPDDSNHDNLIFTVLGSDHGHLRNSIDWIELGVGDTFTLADIEAGRIFYQAPADYTGQDHIRLSLSDNVSGAPTVLVDLGATSVDAQLTVLTTAGYDFVGESPAIVMGNGVVVPDATDPDASFTIVNADAGRKFVYSGAGFAYSGPDNVVTAGSVVSITETDLSDHPLARLDINVDAAAWYGAIVAKAAGDGAPLETLATGWTFMFLGNSGNDAFDGGDLNDYFAGRPGNDTFLGHFGYDRANYSNASGSITVSLAAGTVTGDASVGTDTLDSIEMVTGTAGADLFDARGFNATSQNAGSTVANNVAGTFNEFEGRGGDDTIYGNASTRISYYHATAGVTVTFDPDDSWNTAVYAQNGGVGVATGDDSVGTDHFWGVNSVRGSFFDDTFTGSTNPSGTAENFEGLGGDDYIDGGGGFDRAYYNLATDGAGIDVQLAAGIVTGGVGTGTDTLRSVEGIWGTEYDDTYDATGFTEGDSPSPSANSGSTQNPANPADVTSFNEFEGGGGNDTITGNGNTRIAFYRATSGVLVQLGDGGTHGIALGSSTGQDDIVGGVPRVRGSEFNDWIVGNADANTLEGQSGNDLLRGLGNFDVYTGGAGADTFVFDAVGGLAATGNVDTINDFKGHGNEGDRIDVRTVPGITSFSQLVLTQVGANTEITFGTYGPGNLAKIILIGVNSSTLNASDFIIGNQVNVQVQTPDGYDFSNLYDDMAGSVVQPARDGEHMLVHNSERGITFLLIGSGFEYDASGHPTAGTINEIHILDANPADFTDYAAIHDHTLVDSDGWAIDATGLFNSVGNYASSNPGIHASGLASLNSIFNSAHYSVAGASGFVTTDTEGHSGNDVLFGGNQADSFVGLSGSDTVDYSHAAQAVAASLASPAANTGAAAGDLYTSIENLRGTDFADTLTGDGNNNVLEGGPSGDSLVGGGGADTASYQHATAGVSVDLATPGNNTGEAASDSYDSIENIRGSSFDDTLTGDNGDNTIEGDLGNNTIIGGGGNNTASYEHAAAAVTVNLSLGGAQMTGGAGTDTLSEIQNLVGSQYNDLLTGSSADNILHGMGGSDTFVFNTLSVGGIGHDTIGDFSSGEDHIELDYEAFEASGSNDFSHWIASHATSANGGQDTLIDLDPDGLHPGEQTILLKNVAIANLHASDFILPAGGGIGM